MEFCTAVSKAVLAPPPKLILATACVTWSLVTQSTPLMTPEVVPLPAQFSTFTATSHALGNAVGSAADWAGHVRAVPIAVGVQPSPVVLVPNLARPPKSAKSVWVVRMPVSMMYAVTPAPVLVKV